MPRPNHSIFQRRVFTKRAITFAAQLQKLKDRGLLVTNDERALRYLANISYYRLSGYWATYLDAATGQFRAETTFDDIINLYRFDKKLRLLCLEAMERLEIAFRTQIIYHFTHAANDTNWYEQSAFFKQSIVLALGARTTEAQDTQRLLDTILGSPGRSQGELTRAKDKEFIADYYRFYHTPANPPAWMALEVLSFGTLFNLFRLFADKSAKINVAKHFKLHLSVFESWMQSLNVVRNKCAHHERFWDLSIRPLITNQGDRSGLWLRQPSARTSTTKIYYVVSVLHFLLVQITPRASLCDKVFRLLNDHQLLAAQAHTRYMGFPADWQQETMWTQM
ncbi:MAG: Abi family protein [Janthinobacterium lividum]